MTSNRAALLNRLESVERSVGRSNTDRRPRHVALTRADLVDGTVLRPCDAQNIVIHTDDMEEIDPEWIDSELETVRELIDRYERGEIHSSNGIGYGFAEPGVLSWGVRLAEGLAELVRRGYGVRFPDDPQEVGEGYRAVHLAPPTDIHPAREGDDGETSSGPRARTGPCSHVTPARHP